MTCSYRQSTKLQEGNFSQISDSVHRGGGRWVLILLGWTLTPRGWVLASPGIHGPGILQDNVDQREVCILLEYFLVTAHKWSLGQGNIFTCVWHSVHTGRGLCPGGLPDRNSLWTEIPLDRDPQTENPLNRDPQTETPPRTVESGRYASYWIVFLLIMILVSFIKRCW